MNYYKQGDPANADKIKAAFEKLGYDTSRFYFNIKSILYFTLNGEIRTTTDTLFKTFIKTRTDYKELELPVEPKFAIGQIICPTAKSGLQPVNIEVVGVDVDKQRYTIKQKGYAASILPFKFQDRYALMYIQSKPHYDIKNFHAGMPVLVRDDRWKKWCYALYSHHDNEDSYQFVTAGDSPFIQCIPFEGNEHLLGTTDTPSEEYINW